MRKKIASALPAPQPAESPLVPNRVIQQIYQTMLKVRLLEGHGKIRSILGEAGLEDTEASRIAPLAALHSQDWIADLPGSLAGAVHLQRTPAQIFRRLKLQQPFPSPLLPALDHSSARVHLALGAALSLRELKQSRVVILFTDARVKSSLWKEAWRLASVGELPLIFVVLAPASSRKKKHIPFELSARATAAGVPGIPVDASDAIALYRVAQESVGRARAGGGPALIECVPYPTGNQKSSVPADPLKALETVLLRKQICGPDWIKEATTRLRRELRSL